MLVDWRLATGDAGDVSARSARVKVRAEDRCCGSSDVWSAAEMAKSVGKR